MEAHKIDISFLDEWEYQKRKKGKPMGIDNDGVDPVIAPPEANFDRGRSDCFQDRCENIPFGSVGGLESREDLRAPKYINPGDAAQYLAGYIAMAKELYGDDWQTCEFSWKHAMTINQEHEETISNLEEERDSWKIRWHKLKEWLAETVNTYNKAATEEVLEHMKELEDD
jgi:hypothetical protein